MAQNGTEEQPGRVRELTRIQRIVPFGHCDPAGILYTPRALDYCLEAIDEFWKSVLGGKGWYELNVDLDRGTPFVNVNIDFRSPVAARSILDLSVEPIRLGTSSVTFAVTAYQDDRLCFEATLTSVIVVKSTLTKVAADDWVRQALGDALGEKPRKTEVRGEK